MKTLEKQIEQVEAQCGRQWRLYRRVDAWLKLAKMRLEKSRWMEAARRRKIEKQKRRSWLNRNQLQLKLEGVAARKEHWRASFWRHVAWLKVNMPSAFDWQCRNENALVVLDD